jgi:3-hydroxyacyl-[acyl-carrier-protein] dehydratase
VDSERRDEKVVFNRAQIEQILPHADPFLFVDRIVELEPGKRIVGVLDDLSSPLHDRWLSGHFPGYRVVPGAILIEALAEVGAVAVLTLPGNEGKVVLLAGVDKWRFRRPVFPGDYVRLEATITQMRLGVGKGQLRALSADGAVLAEGEISFALAPKPAELGP